MIYYVEDDTNVRELTLYALQHAGFEVMGFEDAASFRVQCRKQLPDLVLLDIMLPGTDGIQLLSDIRANPKTHNLPVMMLSAKSTEYDKVLGLDSGADDYLAKPFGMVELVSRCKALLRRSQENAANAKSSANTLMCGCITLSINTHEATCAGNPLDLTLKEFDLLAKLMGEPGRAFNRKQLLADVWDISFAGGTRTVDTHVQTLRRKLNAASPGAGDMIQTVRGVGYRIKGVF